MFLWILSRLLASYNVIILLSLAVLALYIYGKWTMGFFERRGVKSLPFDYPFVGHMYKALSQKEHFKDAFDKHYHSFPGEKYVGFMQLNRPLIILKDLDLIKQTTIKDFDHFVNHAITIDEDTDSIFGTHLFALKGEKWKDMRSTLSPAFTSSKMRNMFQFISETAEQMVHHYTERMKERKNRVRGLVEIEMKNAFTRYTNDVIATSAFGIKVNSLDEEDNEFYNMGKRLTDFSGYMTLKFFLFSSFPRLMKMTKIQLIDERMKNFYRDLVNGTMEKRECEGIVRNDMINLLMQAKKGILRHEDPDKEDAGFATVQESDIGRRTVRRKWSDDDIVAQAVLFFIAGFDSAATLLAFMAYEIAVNPDIQRKLQEEVDDMIKEKGEHLEYNDLVKMKYMDKVVSETLRMWPTAVFLDRECAKMYKLPPSSPEDEEGYTIKAGEGICIPIYSIHHDPRYFPNPSKFDPERFSDENKDKIHPMSFIPFGVGPRNCIGSRFALMEIKAVMFHLMAHFSIVTTSKTPIPMVISKKTFSLTSETGFWLGLKPRKVARD